MSRRRTRSNHESETLTKEEEKYARFLRFNCPTKSGQCDNNDFSYFVGQKAVDTLLESSKFGPTAKEPVFKNKGDVEVFIRTLMNKGAIFRAKKFVLKKKDPEEKKKHKKLPPASSTPTSSPKTKRERELLKQEEERREESDSGTDAKESKEKDEKEDEKKEKKKKVVLVYQQNQMFTVDTNDVYVWVFDPTPLHKQIIGGLMIVGVVAGCLFPLWPAWLRLCAYYLSLAGVGFMLSILVVALLRTILFAIIYVVTLGKHNLWVLPNLVSDCGFVESFIPFYTYEYIEEGWSTGKKKKKGSKGANKASKESKQHQDTEDDTARASTKESSIDEDDQPAANGQSEDEDQKDEHSENSVSEDEEEEEATEEASPAFEAEPAEEFVPEPRKRRANRGRRDDDYVVVDGPKDK